MRIKFWGVRGSIPAPIDNDGLRMKLQEALAFARSEWQANPNFSSEEVLNRLPIHTSHVVGGETTCVEVQSKGTRLIIDLGTGSRKLGIKLAEEMKKGGDLHILMTHTHWDHIQGFPFFTPAFIPYFRLYFHSALPDLETRLAMQQRFEYFPVRLDQMAAPREFLTFQPGDVFKINDLEVSTAALIHPGGSIAYRITDGKKVFVFSTDTEFFGPELLMMVKRYDWFYHGADMAVLDAQYSILEAEQKVGWGHTAMLIAVDCAINWKIKRLLLTHHEPTHNDRRTLDIFENAVAYADKTYGKKRTKIQLAMEGAEYRL